jgi:hypothetical protein
VADKGVSINAGTPVAVKIFQLAALKLMPLGQFSGRTKGSGMGGMSRNSGVQSLVAVGATNENTEVPVASIGGKAQPVVGIVSTGMGL